MEILPLGPCMITDTAGLDDTGELGRERVRKSLDVLATADIAVWVEDARARHDAPPACKAAFLEECRKRNVKVFEYRRGDDVEELKRRIAAAAPSDEPPALLKGLVAPGDHIVLVCPIDESAPKGRLILPQVQTIRECLDTRATCTICQPAELASVLARTPASLVITDSQAFAEVGETLASLGGAAPRLTSFSLLFARQKGDIDEYAKGLAAIGTLRDGDRVLIAEGCTHHRQCNDIGTVKLPKALTALSGMKLAFEFASGPSFAIDPENPPRLVVQCGGCMLTRREVMRRIELAKAAGVPITNYGMVLRKNA